MALQFHLEITEESLTKLTGNCREELIKINYIQSEEVMMSDMTRFTGINRIMDALLNHMKTSFTNS